MNFTFLCPFISAAQQYGLYAGLFFLCVIGATIYFQQSNAIAGMFGVLIVAVIILRNITTISGWLGLNITCVGII